MENHNAWWRPARLDVVRALLVTAVATATLTHPASGRSSTSPDIREALKAPFPLSRLVDKAIGGAREPEVDPLSIIKAIDAFKRADQKRFNTKYQLLAQGIAAALDQGVSRGSKLSRGFTSHRRLLGRLEGATVRLRQQDGLVEPLEGGEDLGLPLDALGTLLAASALDELGKNRVLGAEKYGRHLLLLGRLIEGAARTLNELETSVNLVRRGLMLLSRVQLKRGKPRPGEAERLRLLAVEISDFGRRLGAIRRAMKDSEKIEVWGEVAAQSPRLLWQHTAVEALGLLARKQERSDAARKTLTTLSERTDRVGTAAKIWLSRIR